MRFHSDHDLCIYIFVLKLYLYIRNKIMADIPNYDPTRDDEGAAGGARGGGDDDTQDYNLPGGPTDSPDEQRRRWWQKGARPKDPRAYQRLPHDDKDIPMSEFPKEKSGLPKQRGSAETSFTDSEGNLDYAAAREFLANEISNKDNIATGEVENDFPNLDKDQLDVRYKVITRQGTRVRAILEVKMKHKEKWYPLYTKKRGDTEKTFNNRLPKEIQSALDPLKGIREEDARIQQMDQYLKDLAKLIEEDKKVAEDENERDDVRARGREKIKDNLERKAQDEQEREQAVREREQIVESLPLRERARIRLQTLRERLAALFKKYGFSIATVVTAVSITIGVLAKILADGASAAANGIRTVGKKVGNGLQELGKRIGAILPGLVGAIASFVFRAAGQAISFLAKNAWLLVLAVVAFMIQKLTEKK